MKLFYVNQLGPNRHTREDPVHGTSDILDMAFITPGLSSRDISFRVADDHMGSEHFPIQISLDKPLKQNTPLTEPRYRFGKTNDDLLHNEKVQLFAESVERNFGIESHLFSKLQFDRINKFIEAHSYHFTPLESLHDNVTDTDDDSDLVADVDPDTFIRIVRHELKNGKAPGIDNVYNDILKKAIGTGFYKLSSRAFTISLKLGFISYVWKVAVICMLIKPDKPPSQTTRY